jgi:protease-4
VLVRLGGVGARTPRLAAALEQLRAIGEDPAVTGVVVELGDPGGGWATAGALAEALAGLRAAGKTVELHVDHLGLPELRIGAPASRLTLSPGAEPALSAPAPRLVTAGAALARLGVEVRVLAAGRFKSAGELVARAYPSAAAREQAAALADDLRDGLLTGIAADRGLPGPPWSALGGPRPAEELVAVGLVDGIVDPDDGGEGPPPPVGARTWARTRGLAARLGRPRLGAPRVACVHLEGPVVDGAGAGRGPQICPARANPALQHLVDDDTVVAVVLAISTSGGSALASDRIARAVQRLAARKPVVVAMGDVCASGGYYIAAPAKLLVAHPQTLTGSIGVIAARLELSGALRRAGVHIEHLRGGPGATLADPTAPLSPEDAEALQASIDRSYQRFLEVVAAGRGLPRDAVHAVAQGRVWTGRQALGAGLVDELGALPHALRRAAELAACRPEDVRVVHISVSPDRRSLVRAALGLGGAQVPALMDLAEPLRRAEDLLRRPGAALAWAPDLGLRGP